MRLLKIQNCPNDNNLLLIVGEDLNQEINLMNLLAFNEIFLFINERLSIVSGYAQIFTEGFLLLDFFIFIYQYLPKLL